MRYFTKIYPNQAFILKDGRSFKFPKLDNGIGAIATENPILLNSFDLGIAKKVGGVVEITAEEFEALKKKAPAKNHHEALRPSEVVKARLASNRAAAEAAGKATQMTPVKRSFKRPEQPPHLNPIQYRPGTIDRK